MAGKKALAAPKVVPTNVFPALQGEEKRAKCHSLKYEIEMLGTIREFIILKASGRWDVVTIEGGK